MLIVACTCKDSAVSLYHNIDMSSYEPEELLSLLGVWGLSALLGVAMGLCSIALGVWTVFPVVSFSP